jgi:hypothetical protein
MPERINTRTALVHFRGIWLVEERVDAAYTYTIDEGEARPAVLMLVLKKRDRIARRIALEILEEL